MRTVNVGKYVTVENSNIVIHTWSYYFIVRYYFVMIVVIDEIIE